MSKAEVIKFVRMRVVALVVGVFIILCLPLAALRIFGVVFTNPVKAWYIFKAFDLTGNVLLNGKFNEYISTRAYRAMQEGRKWGCVLCRWLDDFDPDHCQKSANPDKPL